MSQCLHTGNIVVDSRPYQIGLRRRRKCPHCGERWNTYEIREEEYEDLYRQAHAEANLSRRIIGVLKQEGLLIMEDEQGAD